MKNKRLRLEEKFVLIIALVGVICFGLLGVLTYRQVSDIVLAQKRDAAQAMAVSAAEEIDGDMLAAVSSENDAAYQELYQKMQKYQDEDFVAYAYVLKKDGDELRFVVDTDPVHPAAFQDICPLRREMKQALTGTAVFSSEVVSDKWGEYFSAYAPVKDSSGAVVGLAGIDIGSNEISSIQTQLKYLLAVLITVFAGVSILIYIYISNSLMSKDLLTEIYNYDKLIKVGKRLERRKRLCTFTGILINIKDFSYINQQLGASGGDLILRAYAGELKRRVRHYEFVASIGGDSYFALIKNERVTEFLESLKNISLSVRVKQKEMTFPLVARCGIYQIPEKTGINEVMNCCSMALDDTKLQYNNDVKWFEKRMFEQMAQEQEVLNAFRIGMARREFVVYYQPKVNLNTNDLCGAEALVRWFRNGKMVPPDQFIPILEKNNMVVDLDFYVFEQVCKDIRDWLDRGIDMVPISSNFSKMHLRNADFADEILSIKEKYNIDAAYIDTELTESSGFYDLDALIHFVTKMNESKISVSIDDFGTGYSSLSLLKDLNVDVVKMDKSFFRAMDNGEQVQAKMVANVIRMVQDLNREVISEGIETQKQADFLRSIHSPIVQGYLFDKPLPHNEFEKRLKSPHYKTESEKEEEEKTEKNEAGEKKAPQEKENGSSEKEASQEKENGNSQA